MTAAGVAGDPPPGEVVGEAGGRAREAPCRGADIGYERAVTRGRARLPSQLEGTWRSAYKRPWTRHMSGSRSSRPSGRE
ncbi:hypothetical protein Taro_045074 [Colocasia esculenta]|uniref:Uncharacterized protein n=1 Tax=Colocasia esculenta TaxID=4460 RepID=A0A843X649_COLES|nr:hypothetical protein [Colocasia esculenta]